MSPTTKRDSSDSTMPADAARETAGRRKADAREDAEASRQDRPGTSLPTQRERWENEGGAPGGVISSTDAVAPKKAKD